MSYVAVGTVLNPSPMAFEKGGRKLVVIFPNADVCRRVIRETGAYEHGYTPVANRPEDFYRLARAEGYDGTILHELTADTTGESTTL